MEYRYPFIFKHIRILPSPSPLVREHYFLVRSPTIYAVLWTNRARDGNIYIYIYMLSSVRRYGWIQWQDILFLLSKLDFFPLNFETLAWWKQNIHTYIYIVCEERDAYINCTGVTFFFCLKNMPELWECSCGGGAHVHSLSTKASDRQSHRTASRGSHGRHNGRRPPPSDPCRLIKMIKSARNVMLWFFPSKLRKFSYENWDWGSWVFFLFYPVYFSLKLKI